MAVAHGVAHLIRERAGRGRVACLELHTCSSLNPDFLPQYAHCFGAPDVAVG